MSSSRVQMSRWGPVVTTSLVVLAVVVPHVLYASCVGEFGNDGGYYTDIAQNVRDGFGVASDVSVFHQGYQHFPHPTAVYPAWPIVYGLAARLAPIEQVAIWLPTLLSFVSLGLAFFLGKRLSPAPLLPGYVPGLHGGHVWLFVTGSGIEMVKWTSMPYTEGLAFTLLFAFFLRTRSLWRRLGLWAGLEVGAWLVLLFLTRSQFLVVGLAALVALPVALWRRPAAAAAAFAGAAATATAGWLAYASWLDTFLIDSRLSTYLRFDQTRATEGLSRIPIMVPLDGIGGRIADLAESFVVAFSFFDSSRTYYGLHHGFIHAVPAAALLVVFGAWRRRHTLLRWLRAPGAPFGVFLATSALGLMLSLHTVHKVFGNPWVFGERQGLPSLLVVAGSVILLLRARSVPFRAFGVMVLSIGAYTSLRSLSLETQTRCEAHADEDPRDAYRADVVAWLLQKRAELGSLTVVIERPEAQRLSWRTPGVGFHWATHTTSVEDVTTLFRDFGADYAVDFDTLSNTTYRATLEFPERFVLAAVISEVGPLQDGSPRMFARERYARIFAPRCSAFPKPLRTCLESSPVPLDRLPETYAPLPVIPEPVEARVPEVKGDATNQ